MDEVEEFLSHYGVKGMKWGVRRATKLAERSASNSEATPYRQAKIDTKARDAAVKVRGKGSTAPKKLTRGVIKERMQNDPEYKAAKERYDRNKFNADSAKIAAVALGVVAAPHILGALEQYSRDHVVDSLHKVTYKSFEKSAYGQRRREQGQQFVDNTGHQVVGPGVYEVARRR